MKKIILILAAMLTFAAQDTVRRLFIVAAASYDDYLRRNNNRFAANPYTDLLYLETSEPLDGKWIHADTDGTTSVVEMAGVNISGDDPEYESSEPYRELYRADGTCSYYDLIDGQWVEEETLLSEYFADGPLFCFRWQKPGKELRRENWEIIS